MFEKYINLIQTHRDNKKEIQTFLNQCGLSNITFNINGDSVDFIVPAAFKLRLHSKKEEIIEFLKSKNLKPKNL